MSRDTLALICALCAVVVSICGGVAVLSNRISHVGSSLTESGHYHSHISYPPAVVDAPAKDVWNTTVVLKTPDGKTKTFKKYDMLGCWFWNSAEGWHRTSPIWGDDACVCHFDAGLWHCRIEIANPDEWLEMYTSESPEAFLLLRKRKQATEWDHVQDARIDSLMERAGLREGD